MANALELISPTASSKESIVSFTASAVVSTRMAGKATPTLPCQAKCLMMEVSAAATVESSVSSRGMVMSSSMSSPVSVSTGAARSARSSLLERLMSYTPRMLRRSEREPLVVGGFSRAAFSKPPLEVAAGFLPRDEGPPPDLAPPAASFSAAIRARRSSAAFSAASASSSTGGVGSRHSPSRSVHDPSPFSSMLMRPSASRPSAAPPMDWRFLLTTL
mmetsp:Transcript_14151/g.38881  ORF Transcript_14151/g.38881 Transcript_14151/m.38881 type:complete len:217 (-) Transcript_14151:549-1199(-)